MIRRFTVSFHMPPNTKIEDAKKYIFDAVECYGGCLRPPGGYGEDDPGDPFFGGPKLVRVVSQPRKHPKRRERDPLKQITVSS